MVIIVRLRNFKRSRRMPILSIFLKVLDWSEWLCWELIGLLTAQQLLLEVLVLISYESLFLFLRSHNIIILSFRLHFMVLSFCKFRFIEFNKVLHRSLILSLYCVFRVLGLGMLRSILRVNWLLPGVVSISYRPQRPRRPPFLAGS